MYRLPSAGLGTSTPALDTVEGRAFARTRLALFAKTVFFLAAGSDVVLLVLSHVLRHAAEPMHFRLSAFHLIGALVAGLLWLVARLRDWRLATLRALDAVGIIVLGMCWALLMNERPETTLVALLAGIVTVNARAVIIPSTARRTFWLSLAALSPTLVCTVLIPERPAAAASAAGAIFIGTSTALWIGIGVAGATVASSVIYGLRKMVKEATELGQYTLDEQIGSGGMGEVWRAHHRLLIRPAAVKLIRPQALGSTPSDPEVLLRRFEREARATAALQSPHTVQLYDFGVADDGTLYYVMELLEGFNLEQLVERFGPQPAERVVHILLQACCSLADAHDKGLVHRDIKPANLFLGRFGMAYDFVKVLDFGLVKLHQREDSEDALRLTGVGVTTGTPAFMAPEIAVGEERTDHRVDIYSLGCVAYWLLTGRLVFEGGTRIKTMMDHAQRQPAPPSTRVELPIPADLEQLVLDCLAKDPADRPASAIELATRLMRCALAARWSDERAERWWSTHVPALTRSRSVSDLLLAQEEAGRAAQLSQRPTS